MIKERILQYIDYKSISKYKFYQITGLANGFLDKEGAISTDKCKIIVEKFPDINLEWLITGEGKMLKNNTESKNIVSDTFIHYTNDNQLNKSEILDKLKDHYHFKTDAQLADFLEVTPSTIATWRKRDTLDYALIIAKCNEINANWLLTGSGNMFTISEETIETVKTFNENLKRAIEDKQKIIEMLEEKLKNLKK